MRLFKRRALCLLLALLLLVPSASLAAEPPVAGPEPGASEPVSAPDPGDPVGSPGPEPSEAPEPPVFTGAAWEVAGLETLQARLGPLPGSMAAGGEPVSAAVFARLCALATGNEEEIFLSRLPDPEAAVITREQAVTAAAAAVLSPLRAPLAYADAADIDPAAVDSVEKLLRCGVLSSGNADFDPRSPMTNACAAILTARLMDADRSAPAVLLLTAMSFVGGDALSEEQKELLLSYGTRYLDALIRLDPADLSDLFDPANSAAGSELDNTVLSLQCRRWARSPIDLTAGEASYRYSCTRVKSLKNGRVQVSVDEYRAFAFRGVAGVSEAPLMKHVFTLSRLEDGSWRIWAHEWNDNGYTALHDALEAGLDLAEAGERMLRQADEAYFAREATRGQEAAALTAKNPYDREAACAYANTYVDTRAPGYPDYSNSGGNCQNYVSQCLHAGGVPTNKYWKPGVATWSSTRWFDRYILYNNKAPVAQWGAPFYTAEPGDVVHCRFADDELYRHAMLITGVIRDADGNVLDYLVCSNTCNWRNFPLSAHWYDTDLIIKIYGWK